MCAQTKIAASVVLSFWAAGCYGSHVERPFPDAGDAPPDAGPYEPAFPASPPDGGAGEPPVASCPFHAIVGGNFGVALHDDGRVFGWGWDVAPQPLAALEGAVQVDVGDNVACGALGDGSVRCATVFGSGFGALSAGPVAGIDDAVQVAVGNDVACAITSGGRVACWGYNRTGVIQSPQSVEVYLEPVFREGIDDAVQISIQDGGACVRHADARVECWGRFSDWAFGSFQPMPADLMATEVVARASGACAITPDDGVVCWGDDAYGELGDGSLAGLDAVRLHAGALHTCAELRSGALVCWGLDDLGQLGRRGTPTENAFSATPRSVPGAEDALAMSTGRIETCLLRPDCVIECFGNGPSLRTLPGR